MRMPLESLETEQTLLGSSTDTEWTPVAVRHPIVVLFILKLFEVLTLRHLKYLILIDAFCNIKETSIKPGGNQELGQLQLASHN